MAREINLSTHQRTEYKKLQKKLNNIAAEKTVLVNSSKHKNDAVWVLDLHYLLENEVEMFCNDFIDKAKKRGQKCFKIVTGKGRHRREEQEGGPVLNSKVASILNRKKLTFDQEAEEAKDSGWFIVHLM